MVQASVEGYQEEQPLLCKRLIRLAALSVVGFFIAILTSVALSGLGSTAYAANGTAVTAPAVTGGFGGGTAVSAPAVTGGFPGRIGGMTRGFTSFRGLR